MILNMSHKISKFEYFTKYILRYNSFQDRPRWKYYTLIEIGGSM